MTVHKVIALDLGGTQIRAALFMGEKMIRRAALNTDVSGGPEGVFTQIDFLIGKVLGNCTLSDVMGVGMACAGPIDTELGIVTHIPTLPGWDGLPLVSELSGHLGLPVRVESDCIAAALGEWRYGAGKGIRNMFYLSVSTGIGGGSVIDGKLLHGHKGMAAHIGHIRLAQQGPQCNCGAIGCFEAFAAGTALRKIAVSAAAKGASAFLERVSQTESLEAKHVFDGARAGDSYCCKLINEEATYLGQGITAAIHMYSPEKVIIGGGLSHGFDLLDEGIHEIIQRDAMPAFKHVSVHPAALAGDSGLWGASSMMLQSDANRTKA